MKTTFKTANGLTTEYIKTIKTAEQSNAKYLVALAKLAKNSKASYDDLHKVNVRLNEACKIEGITTFKNVAMIIGRMYDKKTIKGKSLPYQLNMHVIDSMIALGDKASMAKLQGVRKAGKAKQEKPTKIAKTVTNTAEEIAQVDVKDEIKSIKDEVLSNAKELTKLSKGDLLDKFYNLLSEVEEVSQTFDPLKDTGKTAVIVAKMESLIGSF